MADGNGSRPMEEAPSTTALSHQPCAMSPRADREQALAVLDRLPVLHVDVHHLAVVLRVDLVHQLHRFDDAEDLAFPDGGADVDKRRRARLRRPVEGADDWRLDDGKFDLRVGGVAGGYGGSG